MWRLQLPDGRSLALHALPATLGRDDAASVRVRHASIAPLHARLRVGPDGRLVVEAVGEARVLAGGRPAKVASLQDGDELVLGQVTFIVRGETPAPAAGVADMAEELLAPRARGPAGAPAAPAPGPAAPAALRQRARKPLVPQRPPPRQGLLHADFAQLSGGTKALLLLLLLAAAGGLAWGLAALFSVAR